MIHPRFIKNYALSVVVFSSLSLALFVASLCVLLYYIAVPPVTTLEDFTLAKAHSTGVYLGLQDENKRLFESLDAEDFRQRPEYYYNIAKSDSARMLPQQAIVMFGFSTIMLACLWTHLRLWRRMKALGE